MRDFWWGSVFLVNVPLVLAALIGGRLLVPNSKNPNAEPLDPVGAGLSMVGLCGVLYGIIEGPSQGWTAPATLGSLLSGLAVLVVFGFWELRAAHPMLDLRFFRNPTFSSATAAINLVFFAMFGTFFLLTQYLQLVLGYGTLVPTPLPIPSRRSHRRREYDARHHRPQVAQPPGGVGHPRGHHRPAGRTGLRRAHH